MGDFKLLSDSIERFTQVPNSFIDKEMLSANGSFVKIYLYLLRMIHQTSNLSIEQMADVFSCTEADIIRALKYWEKQELLELRYDENETLLSVSFRSNTPSVATGIPVLSSPDMDSIDFAAAAKEDIEAQAQASDKVVELPKRHSYSPSQMNTLQADRDVKDVLTIVETMMGTTIPHAHLDLILYLMTDLNFSVELVTYLYELSLGKNKQSPRYIEAVALAWAKKDVHTVEDAKAEAANFDTKYSLVTKTFGMSRPLAPPERTIVDGWSAYHFSETVIAEACKRTILQTGEANLPYADKILKDWHKKGVLTMADVEKCDAEYHKIHKNTSNKEKGKPNQFQNFPQRDYNKNEYASLEQQLLQK